MVERWKWKGGGVEMEVEKWRRRRWSGPPLYWMQYAMLHVPSSLVEHRGGQQGGGGGS